MPAGPLIYIEKGPHADHRKQLRAAFRHAKANMLLQPLAQGQKTLCSHLPAPLHT